MERIPSMVMHQGPGGQPQHHTDGGPVDHAGGQRAGQPGNKFTVFDGTTPVTTPDPAGAVPERGLDLTCMTADGKRDPVQLREGSTWKRMVAGETRYQRFTLTCPAASPTPDVRGSTPGPGGSGGDRSPGPGSTPDGEWRTGRWSDSMEPEIGAPSGSRMLSSGATMIRLIVVSLWPKRRSRGRLAGPGASSFREPRGNPCRPSRSSERNRSVPVFDTTSPIPGSYAKIGHTGKPAQPLLASDRGMTCGGHYDSVRQIPPEGPSGMLLSMVLAALSAPLAG